jgi:hypothetical protein
MKTFVTMGPNTNHALVSKRYLEFHGLALSALQFVPDLELGAALVRDKRADYLIACSVHPDVPRITARYFRDLFIVDTFISDSKPLAIATRAEVKRPRSLGLLEPTREYADTSRWPDIVVETKRSLNEVWDGLLRGDYDSALVYLELAERNPERMRIDEIIGSPDDAWVVFGRERVAHGKLVACRDSAFRAQLMSGA